MVIDSVDDGLVASRTNAAATPWDVGLGDPVRRRNARQILPHGELLRGKPSRRNGSLEIRRLSQLRRWSIEEIVGGPGEGVGKGVELGLRTIRCRGGRCRRYCDVGGEEVVVAAASLDDGFGAPYWLRKSTGSTRLVEIDVVHHPPVGAVVGEVILWTRRVDQPSCAHCDMSLNLLPCSLYAFGKSCNFKHWLVIPARCDDVSVGLLLYSLDGSTFWPNNKPHHSVWNSHLNRCLARDVWRRGAWRYPRVPLVSPRSNLAEVLCCLQDFPLCCSNIFLPAGYNKHRILSPDWRLDVCVGFCSQSLDFATCSNEKNRRDSWIKIQIILLTTMQQKWIKKK